MGLLARRMAIRIDVLRRNIQTTAHASAREEYEMDRPNVQRNVRANVYTSVCNRGRLFVRRCMHGNVGYNSMGPQLRIVFVYLDKIETHRRYKSVRARILRTSSGEHPAESAIQKAHILDSHLGTWFEH